MWTGEKWEKRLVIGAAEFLLLLENRFYDPDLNIVDETFFF